MKSTKSCSCEGNKTVIATKGDEEWEDIQIQDEDTKLCINPQSCGRRVVFKVNNSTESNERTEEFNRTQDISKSPVQLVTSQHDNDSLFCPYDNQITQPIFISSEQK